MQSLFTVSAIIYVLIYALRGRGALRSVQCRPGQAILLRDLLMIGPLALLFVTSRSVAMSIRRSVFAAIIALHGAIATFNLGSDAAGDLRRQAAGQRAVRLSRRTRTGATGSRRADISC